MVSSEPIITVQCSSLCTKRKITTKLNENKRINILLWLQSIFANMLTYYPMCFGFVCFFPPFFADEIFHLTLTHHPENLPMWKQLN